MQLATQVSPPVFIAAALAIVIIPMLCCGALDEWNKHRRALAEEQEERKIKLADSELKLIEIRNAAQWALEVGQVVGGSKLALTEALSKTAPTESQHNAKGEARADNAISPHDQTL